MRPRRRTVKGLDLSPGELEIARLIAAGCSNSEICVRLSLRPQTVKNRVSQIYDKTGVRNRVELAILVLRHEAT